MSKTIEDRFWSKVDVKGSGDCWEWKAYINNRGYGNFKYKGVSDKAHRVAWIISNGDIPDGMWVLHRCNNRICVNPEHLFLGDAQESTSETVNKERGRYAARDAREKYDPEFVSYEHVMFTELVDYDASILKWEKRANLCIRNSNIVVLSGYGIKICVRDGSLSIEYQHHDFSTKVLLFNCGVHKIRNIVVTSKGGFVTLDAIFWLQQQRISLYLIDWKGGISQTLSPMQNRNARLAYLQYRSKETGLDIEIARELVRFKAGKQMQAIKLMVEGSPILEQLEKWADQTKHLSDIPSIMMAEARIANFYWSIFAGHPIKWRFSDWKHIPEHWHSISSRQSEISPNGNASQATNPFHATLNFAYALLECQVLEAINVAGLAPEVGFLHTDKEGGNLLAWDMMELFRSDIDLLVLSLFQKTTFSKGDFIQWYTGECRLNDELKRYVLAECRINDKSIDLQCKWLRAMLDQ